MKISKRDQILAALAAFIKQRPGLDARNYISGWNDTAGRSAYFSEMRSITRDRHIAERLLAAVAWRSSIGEKELREAFRAYSGRLTIEDRADGSIALSYCTGQYWPTEYRKAVCAVLASALWAYFRDGCLVAAPKIGEAGEERYRDPGGKGFVSAGDWLRTTAKREFGRDIARRYFD